MLPPLDLILLFFCRKVSEQLSSVRAILWIYVSPFHQYASILRFLHMKVSLYLF